MKQNVMTKGILLKKEGLQHRNAGWMQTRFLSLLIFGSLLIGTGMAEGIDNTGDEPLIASSIREETDTEQLAAGAGWTSIVVDPDGTRPSMKLNSGGFPHISYFDEDTHKYAWKNSSGWHNETIHYQGPYPVPETSLALDSSGNPHIVYYEGFRLEEMTPGKIVGQEPEQWTDFVYKRKDGSGWHSQVLDNWHWQMSFGGDAGGTDNSIALDQYNRPHIAYTSADNYFFIVENITYVRHDGSQWIYNRVGTGTDPSLAIDNAGRPHISYYDNALKYTYYDGATWHKFFVDPVGIMGQSSSLALDSAGHPHISYHRLAFEDNCLRYASYDGTAWHRETVDDAGDVGETSSLALDSAGHPHISYCNLTGNTVKYAYYDGAVWHKMTIGNGKYSSLALDNNGNPHICYEGSDLQYTTFKPLVSGKGVFRPSAWNNWIIDRSMDDTIDVRNHFGNSTDKPLIGDVNNDGKTDRVVFRNGEWIMDYDMDGSINLRNRFGQAGDIPLVGNFNNAGKTDRAVFRNGEWIIDYAMDGTVDVRNRFGQAGDIPLIGRINNNPTIDRAVFRRGEWIIDYGMDGTVDYRPWYGIAGDLPLIGDFNTDEIPDRAVFRAGEWIIDYSMNGSIDARPRFGQAGDIPLVWNL